MEKVSPQNLRRDQGGGFGGRACGRAALSLPRGTHRDTRERKIPARGMVFWTFLRRALGAGSRKRKANQRGATRVFPSECHAIGRRQKWLKRQSKQIRTIHRYCPNCNCFGKTNTVALMLCEVDVRKTNKLRELVYMGWN